MHTHTCTHMYTHRDVYFLVDLFLDNYCFSCYFFLSFQFLLEYWNTIDLFLNLLYWGIIYQNKKMYPLQVVSSINFDKCTYPCNHKIPMTFSSQSSYHILVITDLLSLFWVKFVFPPVAYKWSLSVDQLEENWHL